MPSRKRWCNLTRTGVPCKALLTCPLERLLLVIWPTVNSDWSSDTVLVIVSKVASGGPTEQRLQNTLKVPGTHWHKYNKDVASSRKCHMYWDFGVRYKRLTSGLYVLQGSWRGKQFDYSEIETLAILYSCGEDLLRSVLCLINNTVRSSKIVETRKGT